MNITREKSDEFRDYVERLIEKYKVNGVVQEEKLVVEAYQYAKNISQQHIHPRYLDGHSTGVNSTQTDFNIIMMSIVSICWAVRMRKKKSEEGQCHEHKTNCNEARTFHKERYNEWINVIEEALEVLRSDEPKVEPDT